MAKKDFENLAAFVNTVFGSDGFALFCGAGVSFNSGIPLASQLQYEILSEVLLRQIPKHCSWSSHPLGDDYAKSEKRITDLVSSKVPFEVIMEGALMGEKGDILDIFDCRFPNNNHYSIASLSKLGYIKTIYTTNFDTLVEQAMGATIEEPKERPYYVLHRPTEMHSLRRFERNGNTTSIIKLHGCISDVDSLRITITEVAERRLGESIRPAIEGLFQTGSYRNVVFIGYSFSDNFDINPILGDIGSSEKQIIWIDHAEHALEINGFKEITIPDFLSDFNGWKISCDTSVFMKELLNYYGVSIAERNEDNVFDWKACVNRWGDRNSINNNWQNYMIMGYILSRIGNNKDAIPFLERAAWISSQAKDTEAESYICSLISDSYQHIENSERQELYSRKAVDLSKKENGADFFSLLSQGRVCYEKNDFAGAKLIFESLLKRTELSNEDQKGRVYIGLAIANHGLGRFRESIEFSKKSLKISQDCGDLVNQCSSYMNLGLAYADLDDYPASHSANESAFKIARLMKNDHLVHNIEDNIKRNIAREEASVRKGKIKGFIRKIFNA
jgi:tetratricopeptide (TPR) repeat protein